MDLHPTVLLFVRQKSEVNKVYKICEKELIFLQNGYWLFNDYIKAMLSKCWNWNIIGKNMFPCHGKVSFQPIVLRSREILELLKWNVYRRVGCN